MWPITENKPCNKASNPQRCRTILPSKPSRPPAPRSDDASAQHADHAILCAACNAVITHRNQALQVNDRYEHAFFNPAGIAFTIRCYRQAPGGFPHGEPTSEFTWFPGFYWQIVLCASCQTHLGWLFTGTQSFFGLITTRLV